LKVAFLGPKGTYTHQAVEKYFDSYEPVPCSTLRESLESAETAVIPFENSLGGGVGEAIDLLREKDVDVTGEIRVEIDHVLAAETDIEKIDKVVSHPQALSQCRQIIGEKGWEEVDSSSTAKAAQEIENGEAAICSRLAAEINGLEIVGEDIQDDRSNTTRFLVINGEQEPGGKTSLIVEPGEDRPGLLHSMLSCFSGHEINLSYIQSRPTENGLGDYYFYLEAETDRNSDSYKRASQRLETYADVKTLGSYRAAE
jgi:prephenate dehydratase